MPKGNELISWSINVPSLYSLKIQLKKKYKTYDTASMQLVVILSSRDLVTLFNDSSLGSAMPEEFAELAPVLDMNGYENLEKNNQNKLFGDQN